ncbi:unnamed protein product [Caenorhabditis bovis]|uniref:Gem-associated protein 2 n=1 Tax=Caenorhabditis bovis TaxID=2654633 RepID=A0A8S1EJE5_9PELO|nr:unnamed protein product [Caenorhabditis bovis]
MFFFVFWVREGRKMCPEVVTFKVSLKNKGKRTQWEGVKDLNLTERRETTENCLIPSIEWQEAKGREFAENRDKIHFICANSAAPRKFPGRRPKTDDEEAWHTLLLERCPSEAEHLKASFPNHVGLPPALSILRQFSCKLINELISYLVEWSESEGLTRPIREWIYALLLFVEVPLIPETISSLRELAKEARRTRSRLDSSRIEEANEFSMFIAIIGIYFNQKDLSDLTS